MPISQQSWGIAPTGEAVTLYTLAAPGGLRARITDYGAALVSLVVPDRHGVPGEVVLGYDVLDGYVDGRACLGATIGRVANRVAEARFTLDGETFALDRNLGNHHLHGGSGGFHRRVWRADPLDLDGDPVLALSLTSADGDQGYPGTLRAVVRYTLTAAGLRIGYRAVTDRPTPVSLTNHAYFNLAGAGNGDVLGHVAVLSARRHLVTDPDLIPTGAVADTSGTPLDFSTPTPIGARIGAPFPALAAARGYDHYYILDPGPDGLREVARFVEPGSGRELAVWTDQPGFQFYTGNALDERGRAGATYGPRAGFCVEPSGVVDAPNRPEFPSVILRPGETYIRTTEYRFAA